MIKHTVKKEKDFVQLSNGIFSDSNISLKAKGILALMLSLPESWKFSIEGIAHKCKESRHSIGSAIKELEHKGYLKRKTVRGTDGKIIGMEYEVYEKPCTENPLSEIPITDNASAEFSLPEDPSAENPTTDNLPTENSTKNNIKTNKTENINNIFINTQSNPILSHGKVSFNMANMAMYRGVIKNNIEYEILLQRNPMQSDMLDEIVELMTEAVCSKKDTTVIASNTYPTQLVKNKFLKINSEHIEYVLECMSKNTTQIANIKQYLLTAVFNAPNTIGSYYRSQVNHDLYG